MATLSDILVECTAPCVTCGKPTTAVHDGKDTQVTARPLFFDKLPREIRDEIYKLAYVDGEEVVTISDTETWTERERRRRQDNYHDRLNAGLGAIIDPLPAARPLLLSPFANMLACKQFFDEAAAAWSSQKTVKVDTWTMRYSFSEMLGRCPGLKRHLARLYLPSLWGKPIRIFFGSSWDNDEVDPGYPADVVDGMNNLRFLTIEIDDELFGIIDNSKIPCVHEYTESEITRALNSKWEMPHLPALQSLRLIPQDSGLVEDEGEHIIWHRNVATLEKVLMIKLKEKLVENLDDAWNRENCWNIVSSEIESTYVPIKSHRRQNSNRWPTISASSCSKTGDCVRSDISDSPSLGTWGNKRSSMEAQQQTPGMASKVYVDDHFGPPGIPSMSDLWQQPWVKNIGGMAFVFISFQTISGVVQSWRSGQIHIESAVMCIISLAANILGLSWFLWSDDKPGHFNETKHTNLPQ